MLGSKWVMKILIICGRFSILDLKIALMGDFTFLMEIFMDDLKKNSWDFQEPSFLVFI